MAAPASFFGGGGRGANGRQEMGTLWHIKRYYTGHFASDISRGGGVEDVIYCQTWGYFV